MKNYNELLEGKYSPEDLITEGFTFDIVATFMKDGKAGAVTVWKDEFAGIYMIANSYKDKGTIFTAKQWKEIKNAMKLYEKI